MQVPTRINFTPSSQDTDVSGEEIDEEIAELELQRGSYYVVATESELGFLIVECCVVTETGFTGVVLEKCSDESAEKLFFRD